MVNPTPTIPLFGIAKTARALRALGVDVPSIIRSPKHPTMVAAQALMEALQTPQEISGRAHVPFSWHPELIPAYIKSLHGPGSQVDFNNYPELHKPFVYLPRRTKGFGLSGLRGRFRPTLQPEDVGPVALTHEVGHRLNPPGTPSPFEPRATTAGRQITTQMLPYVAANIGPELNLRHMHPSLSSFLDHDLAPKEIKADTWVMLGLNAIKDRAGGQRPLLSKDEMRKMVLEEVLRMRSVSGEKLARWRDNPAWSLTRFKAAQGSPQPTPLGQYRIPGVPTEGVWTPRSW